MSLTIEVHGAVCGTLWMPPVVGWKEVRTRFTLRGQNQPFAPRVESIREALERAARDDGNFQTAGRLTADSGFTIERTVGNRTVRRLYFVEQFPEALRDLVNTEVYGTDGLEDGWDE
jgi:hypothetical protein